MRDEPIGFFTDRLLSPRSVSRATVSVLTGGVAIFGRLRYDPVRRRVRFVPDPGSMFAGTEYALVVQPSLAAWDGTLLGDRLTRSFQTGTATYVDPGVPSAPTLSHDVAPLLAPRCAQSSCHGAVDPVMGLDLSSAGALRRTTFAIAAREAPGAYSGATSRTDPQWSAMDRVDSVGDPAYSYLVYKLLGDGPIRGDRMPPPPYAPLAAEEIAVVSDWIARGAPED